MKRSAIVLLLAGFTALALYNSSCQSTKSAASAKMLKFDFEKGKGYDYEMTTSLDQEIMGQTMKMDMSMYYSLDVKDDDGDSKTIESKVDRFKMKSEVMGMNIDVDTDQPIPEGDDKNPLVMVKKLFGAIKGQQFSMKVNAEGKVLEVSGFDDMAQTIVESLGVDEEEKEQMKKQFADQFNAESMGDQFERMWYIFPNKEVKVGDSWEKTSKISGTMPGNYHSTYKVTDIEGDMVTLEEKTKVDSEGEEDNVKVKMKGDITGTIVVDSRSGLVVNADHDMKFAAGAEGVNFEMKAKSKVKGKAR